MRQPKANQQWMPVSDCNCGCCGCPCGPPPRAFLTPEEMLERLKNYREQLEKELSGVRQRIGEIEKE